MDDIQQYPPLQSGARLEDADGRVECRQDGYGHAATLGQRKSVAHMPTAATTNANSNRSLISKQGAADLSTLTQLARGPAHGGHFSYSRLHSGGTGQPHGSRFARPPLAGSGRAALYRRRLARRTREEIRQSQIRHCSEPQTGELIEVA